MGFVAADRLRMVWSPGLMDIAASVGLLVSHSRDALQRTASILHSAVPREFHTALRIFHRLSEAEAPSSITVPQSFPVSAMDRNSSSRKPLNRSSPPSSVSSSVPPQQKRSNHSRNPRQEILTIPSSTSSAPPPPPPISFRITLTNISVLVPFEMDQEAELPLELRRRADLEAEAMDLRDGIGSPPQDKLMSWTTKQQQQQRRDSSSDQRTGKTGVNRTFSQLLRIASMDLRLEWQDPSEAAQRVYGSPTPEEKLRSSEIIEKHRNSRPPSFWNDDDGLDTSGNTSGRRARRNSFSTPSSSSSSSSVLSSFRAEKKSFTPQNRKTKTQDREEEEEVEEEEEEEEESTRGMLHRSYTLVTTVDLRHITFSTDTKASSDRPFRYLRPRFRKASVVSAVSVISRRGFSEAFAGMDPPSLDSDADPLPAETGGHFPHHVPYCYGIIDQVGLRFTPPIRFMGPSSPGRRSGAAAEGMVDSPGTLHVTAFDVHVVWTARVQLELFAIIKTMTAATMNLKYALFSGESLHPSSSPDEERRRERGEGKSEQPPFLPEGELCCSGKLHTQHHLFPWLRRKFLDTPIIRDYLHWYHCCRAPWLGPQTFLRVTMEVQDIQVRVRLVQVPPAFLVIRHWSSWDIPYHWQFDEVSLFWLQPEVSRFFHRSPSPTPPPAAAAAAFSDFRPSSSSSSNRRRGRRDGKKRRGTEATDRQQTTMHSEDDFASLLPPPLLYVRSAQMLREGVQIPGPVNSSAYTEWEHLLAEYLDVDVTLSGLELTMPSSLGIEKALLSGSTFLYPTEGSWGQQQQERNDRESSGGGGGRERTRSSTRPRRGFPALQGGETLQRLGQVLDHIALQTLALYQAWCNLPSLHRLSHRMARSGMVFVTRSLPWQTSDEVSHYHNRSSGNRATPYHIHPLYKIESQEENFPEPILNSVPYPLGRAPILGLASEQGHSPTACCDCHCFGVLPQPPTRAQGRHPSLVGSADSVLDDHHANHHHDHRRDRHSGHHRDRGSDALLSSALLGDILSVCAWEIQPSVPVKASRPHPDLDPKFPALIAPGYSSPPVVCEPKLRVGFSDGLRFRILDHPLEAFLQNLQPVWKDMLRTQAADETLFRTVTGKLRTTQTEEWKTGRRNDSSVAIPSSSSSSSGEILHSSARSEIHPHIPGSEIFAMRGGGGDGGGDDAPEQMFQAMENDLHHLQASQYIRHIQTLQSSHAENLSRIFEKRGRVSHPSLGTSDPSFPISVSLPSPPPGILPVELLQCLPYHRGLEALPPTSRARLFRDVALDFHPSFFRTSFTVPEEQHSSSRRRRRTEHGSDDIDIGEDKDEFFSSGMSVASDGDIDGDDDDDGDAAIPFPNLSSEDDDFESERKESFSEFRSSKFGSPNLQSRELPLEAQQSSLNRSTLLFLHIRFLEMEMSLDETLTGLWSRDETQKSEIRTSLTRGVNFYLPERAGPSLLAQLGPDIPDHERFEKDFLHGRHFQLRIHGLQMHCRQFPKPLLTLDKISMSGTAATVLLGQEMHVFGTFQGRVGNTKIHFHPDYLPTLSDLLHLLMDWPISLLSLERLLPEYLLRQLQKAESLWTVIRNVC